METGQGIATARDIRDLCDLYEVTDAAERDRMMTPGPRGQAASAGGSPTTWPTPATSGWKRKPSPSPPSSRRSCTASCTPRTTLGPGHEGAMPRLDPDRIDLQIEAKLTRQRILTRDRPAYVSPCVLDEAALHRMVGGRQVMAAQLAKILDDDGPAERSGAGSSV